MFTIIVSHIGMVYDGPSQRYAQIAFNYYKTLSSERVGNVAGESVVFFHDGDVVKEFNPELKLQLESA